MARGTWVVGMLVCLAFGDAAADRYIVQWRDPGQGAREVLAADGNIVRELGPQNAHAVELTDQGVQRLRSSPNLVLLEPDPRRYPTAQSVPYGIGMVQAPQVWSSATGNGRKVCVIDSGLWLGHADLQTSNVTGYPSTWNQDGCGHGTHVTGTIAALDNTHGVVGVLPNGVSLHVVRVFNDSCSWAYASDLVDALNRCRGAGAQVVNMSLGGTRASTTERNAFEDAWNAGVLSVAAAGNDGTSRKSYPASYPSVISVGAVDASKALASFSQRNDQVELVAPGVGVLSTVSWLEENTLTVNGAEYLGAWIEGGARTTGTTGPLADGGLCTSAGSWAGKVVLCQRGTNSFREKVENVLAGGGVAAVAYNNASGNFRGTLGSGVTSSIPAISLSGEDGQVLVASSIGWSGTVVSRTENPGSGYASWSGTSMATPHVAGVAALVWSYNPAWTAAQLREALRATAQDLGPAGRDDGYGYGLVQAKAALDHLIAGDGGGGGSDGGGGGGDGDPAITLSATAIKLRGNKVTELRWSGATTIQVDVFRDGALLLTTANDGAHDDAIGRGGGSTFTYRVCEGGTATCSSEAQVSF
jgi:serine protease